MTDLFRDAHIQDLCDAKGMLGLSVNISESGPSALNKKYAWFCFSETCQASADNQSDNYILSTSQQGARASSGAFL